MQPITSADWSYTEYAKLPGSVSDDAEGLKEAAKHFESLFINMWLKSAREANAAIAKDSIFSSNEMQMQQQMFDSQMAMHLAKEGGIGLAPTIIRQLEGGTTTAVEDSASTGIANPIPRVETSSISSPISPLGIAPVPVSTDSLVETEARLSGARGSKFEDAKSFIQTLAPKIKGIVDAAGLPALTVMAQAALETGWGKSVIEDGQGDSSHNLFGMKDTNWSGPSVSIHSKEFLLGSWQDKVSGFRSYPDWDAGIADYVQSITNSDRYGAAAEESMGAKDYAEFLQQAGYATDPNYAQKLKAVMHRLVGLGF